jgi:glycosyltransferase involved in cell wall biosynthesis
MGPVTDRGAAYLAGTYRSVGRRWPTGYLLPDRKNKVKKTISTIIYPTDPLGSKVGGVETFIKGFIKYAPDDFDIEFIGISSDQYERPPKKWITLILGKKAFNFYPLFFEKDENKKTFIPLSLRFTIAAQFSDVDTANRVLFFHRIEPALVYRKVSSPKIAVIHTDIQHHTENAGSESLWSTLPRIYFMFEDFIFTSLDYVYTVSNNSLEFYKSRHPHESKKYLLIPTWVDPDVFYPADKVNNFEKETLSREYKLPPRETTWILFVGRLQEVKAPIRLIDTYYEYCKKNKRSCLIVIGEGNLKKGTERHVKELHIENNVFFLGNMNQQMLANFYRASDVLLLTSNFEGMPMCVLEALGSGLPVVTTNVGEVNRVVKNEFSGEVVDGFSPHSITQALEKVMSYPDNYTQANCLSTVTDYTPQKVFKPLYQMMRKCTI